MLLRRERPSDVEAIDQVHRAAFAGSSPGATGDPVEVALVRALRDDEGWDPALSIVAEAPTGELVGHVVATAGSVDDRTVLGLGPLGVQPDRQRSGVGQALMHAVLGAADALDHPLVVLLGHTSYYPQFGFVPAASLGITPPDPSWGDHFQARPLTRWDASLTGEFRYAAPFADL